MSERAVRKADLIIEFVDCYGDPPRGSAEIMVKHTSGEDSRRISAHTNRPVVLRGLDLADGAIFRVLIHPEHHRPESQLVRLSQGENGIRIALTLNPAAVSEAIFPSYGKLRPDLRRVLDASGQIAGFQGFAGGALYETLPSMEKAGLLNLYCKMASTRLANGTSVFSHLSSLQRVAGDRLLAAVTKHLREETARGDAAALFHQVAGHMHPAPFPGLVEAGSYKTYDAFGNLHLTFFRDPATGMEFLDADIDNAQGIQHLAHLIRHTSTNGATHPYDIHQILIYHQKLDPGYRLQV